VRRDKIREARRGGGCPLRPLSSFEVHERLSRTERCRSGYSLPFLLSRGVLPFPSGGAVLETAATAGHFAITIVVVRRPTTVKRSGGPAASPGRWGKATYLTCPPLFVPLLARSFWRYRKTRRRRTIGNRDVSRPALPSVSARHVLLRFLLSSLAAIASSSSSS